MKKNKILILIIIGIFVLAGAIYYSTQPAFKIPLPQVSKKLKDAEKFKEEYSEVSTQNKFVYKSLEEIIEILENGTGLIYFGFPECPWCQKYVVYLDEISREMDYDELYYFNIREARAENTTEYQKVVSLIGDSLDKDDEGNPRIFVPEVVAVKEGIIVGRDNTTSLNTKEDGTPEEWWQEERVEEIKEKLKDFIRELEFCETVCNG